MAASCLFFAAAVGQAPEPIKFRATFVEDERQLGDDYDICDAKPDLSALGYITISSLDTIHAYRVWIEKGKQIEKAVGFWPFAFIDDSQVQGYVGDFCPFLLGNENRLNVFTASASGRSQKTGMQPSAPIAQKSAIQFKPLKEITTFDPSWWPKSKPVAERALQGDSHAESAETDVGTFVNLNYDPTFPGESFYMYGMTETAPLIKTAAGYERLENHLVGSKDLELDKIVWADKSGWIITACRRGEQWGLAWLVPVQSRQAGN
jgi:hypothetical protein